MGPELWIGLVAVFISGGAIGAAGTLLSQWIRRNVAEERLAPTAKDAKEAAILRMEVTELARHVQNLDARLDFQEQLLGGATPTTQAPARLEPGSTPTPSDEAQTEDA